MNAKILAHAFIFFFAISFLLHCRLYLLMYVTLLLYLHKLLKDILDGIRNLWSLITVSQICKILSPYHISVICHCQEKWNKQWRIWSADLLIVFLLSTHVVILYSSSQSNSRVFNFFSNLVIIILHSLISFLSYNLNNFFSIHMDGTNQTARHHIFVVELRDFWTK